MDKFRKFLDSSTWVMFFAAVLFSLMTVVAQNSLPGDFLYGFKLGYEKIMIASSRALNKQVDLQIEFVNRRFSETTKVLATKQGSESLNRLNTEVESTAYAITMIEDPEEQKAAAKKYISQLNYISSGLGQQKMNIARNNPTYAAAVPVVNNQPLTNTNTGSSYTPPSQPSNTNNPASTATNPTSVPTPTPQVNTGIIGDIDDTQETINNTIEKMENIVNIQNDSPAPTPAPTNTPVPTTPPQPTPTTEPTQAPTAVPTEAPTPTLTFQQRLEQWCQEHPNRCDNNGNDNNNNIFNNNNNNNDD